MSVLSLSPVRRPEGGVSVRGTEASGGPEPGRLPRGRATGSPLFRQLPGLLRGRWPRRHHPGIRRDVRHGSLGPSRWAAPGSCARRARFIERGALCQGSSSPPSDAMGRPQGRGSEAVPRCSQGQPAGGSGGSGWLGTEGAWALARPCLRPPGPLQPTAMTRP